MQYYCEIPDYSMRYVVNPKKIALGCQESKLGSTNVDNGASPCLIEINESEAFHSVQILFLLRERSCENDEWIVFTRDELVKMINKERKNYLDYDDGFGETFVASFPFMIDYFLETFCDEIEEKMCIIM